MKYKIVVIFSLLLLLTACAESNKNTFVYEAGKLSFLEDGNIYSVWSPKKPKRLHMPGMKVMFHGRGDGCRLRSFDGPVSSEGNQKFNHARELTGIPLAPDGTGGRWTPSANTPKCNKRVRHMVGDSFVHVNEDPVKGGIGVYTSTGSDLNTPPSFFRQFDARGKGGRGANPHIQGTFVKFLFDWREKEKIRPWGESADHDTRTASFRSVQSVSVADYGVGQKLSGKAIQAKRQHVVALVNQHCFQNGIGKGGKRCKLKYLFNVAVYRAGVENWDKVKWFKHGGVFNDRAQGGMSIVHGPVTSSGQVVRDRRSKLELYSSHGEPTQHGVFGYKEFHIQITFPQLLNALKVAVAKSMQKRVSKVTDDDIASSYSEAWNDPNEWVLISTNVSQEIFNPYGQIEARLGGGVREVEVGAH